MSCRRVVISIPLGFLHSYLGMTVWLGIRYWDGVIVVVVLWVSGFGCCCGSMDLVCVLCVCMGVNIVLV